MKNIDKTAKIWILNLNFRKSIIFRSCTRLGLNNWSWELHAVHSKKQKRTKKYLIIIISCGASLHWCKKPNPKPKQNKIRDRKRETKRLHMISNATMPHLLHNILEMCNASVNNRRLHWNTNRRHNMQCSMCTFLCIFKHWNVIEALSKTKQRNVGEMCGKLPERNCARNKSHLPHYLIDRRREKKALHWARKCWRSCTQFSSRWERMENRRR